MAFQPLAYAESLPKPKTLADEVLDSPERKGLGQHQAAKFNRISYGQKTQTS
jgi:hypothetical protein